VRKRGKTIIPLIIVTVLACTFVVSLEYKNPHFFLDNDNSTQFLPYFHYNWRSIIEHRTIPFLNFHQSLGEPYTGIGQHGFLYPPIYLSAWLSQQLFQNPFYTIDILVASHLVLAAIFMYLLLRRLSIQPTHSILLSLLWISYPYNIFLSKCWANMSFLAAFLPLNLIALNSLLKKPSFKGVLLLATIKTLHFFSGHPHPVIISVIMDILYVLFFLAPKIDLYQPRKTIKAFYPFLASLALTGLLAAPLLLPMYEAKEMSVWRSSAMPYGKVMDNAAQAKHFWPAQVFVFKTQAIYDTTSDILYFGWTNIGLFLLLLIKKIRTQKFPNTALSAKLALIAFILSTSIYGYLYSISPFNVLRGPHKFFPFALFFATLTMGGIIKQVSKNKKRLAQLPLSLLLILSITINIAIVWNNPTNAIISQPVEFPITLDISKYLDKTGRIITQYATSPRKHQYKYLAFDYATLFGFYHFGGFNPLLTKVNHDLTYGLYYWNHFKKPLSQPVLDHLSTWSVKYLINTSNGNKSIPQLTKITQIGNLKLYKNTAAKPFVYSAQRPEHHVPHYVGINHIDAYTNNEEDETLIISFPPLPRWYVFFDDKSFGRIKHKDLSSPIQVEVPAGTRKVTIRYIDHAFVFGTIVSLTTLLAVCFYLAHKNNKNTTLRKRAIKLHPPNTNYTA
jgi:hypothetical protein